MTQLMDHPPVLDEAGDHDVLPARPAADALAGPASPAAGQFPETAVPRRRFKGVLAAAAMVVSLAVVAVAAAALSFPAAARHLHLDSHDTAWLVPAAALAAAVAAVTAWQAARRLLRGSRAADLLTVTGASVATGASASGMWRFFAVYVPQLPVDGRLLVFAFLEIFVLASATRARDNMREFGTAGIDGAAMWAGTCASAFLSCLASTSAAEVLFRFAPPLAAAWLWERQLVTERRRRTRRAGQVSWRISPQRILVRIGLADPVVRDVGEVAAQRRITQVALAAERAGTLAAGKGWRRSRADRQLRAAIRGAVEHAALATDQARQRQLVDQIAVLRGWEQLAALQPDAPWDDLAARSPRGDRRQQPPRPPKTPKAPKDTRPPIDPSDPAGHPGLAEALRQALRDGADGAGRVDELLAPHGDHAGFAAWLGENGKFGSKRILALAGLYATGDLDHPAAAAAWIASTVPGPAGHVDKADIRRMRDLIAPAWERRHQAAAPALTPLEQQP